MNNKPIYIKKENCDFERLLELCPFCNGYAEIVQLGTNRRSQIYRCLICGCVLETGETSLGKDCIWNRRYTAKRPAMEQNPSKEMTFEEFCKETFSDEFLELAEREHNKTREINYRKCGSAVREAWFKYKKDYPDLAKSVTQFVAGYNAKCEEKKTANRGQE